MKIFKLYILFSVFAFLVVPGCKKDPKSKEDAPRTGTRDELTKDSIFLYAKETYLWNKSLPGYDQFDPRSYPSFSAEVDGLSKYQPLDKYSFIDDGSVSTELGGVSSGDYGFFVGFNDGNPLDLRFTYVYKNSPAAAAGIKRGYQIIKLNGVTDLNGRNQAAIDVINQALFGSDKTMSLTVRKFDGSTQDLTLARAVYNIDPILYSEVYTVGNKKVGYFVLNSFVRISEGTASQIFKAKLDALFADFQTQNISELIVDLRYNGGGSVETADYLVNYMAPPSASGVMHVDYYNDLMQKNQATILKNQKFTYQGQQYSLFDYDFSPSSPICLSNFEKKGNLNLSRAYFIVGSGTASASELVINCLKPVMDVKLIGRKTYGKPVGFFAIQIDKYDLYIPQFQTKNKNNQGDYFNGMAVDKEDYDDISKEFGDRTERNLAYALGYAQTGAFPTISLAKTSSINRVPITRMSKQESEKVDTELDKSRFKGMVETRKRPF